MIFEATNLFVRGLQMEDVELILKYSKEQCAKKELPDEVFDSLEETVEGYVIAVEYQGNGYASELVKPLTNWSKQNLNFNSVYGIEKTKNIPSLRCLEKEGFTLKRRNERLFWWYISS